MKTTYTRPIPSLCLAACALALAGCRTARTDVQVRDAEDHSLVVGQSVATRGPLHGQKWVIADTDGIAHVRCKPNWDELDITVAGPGHRTQATGTLKRNSAERITLDPDSTDNGRKLEARLISGEGAPPPPKQAMEANR